MIKKKVVFKRLSGFEGLKIHILYPVLW